MNVEKIQINFIGAGSVGKTLARLFVLNGAATINAVCNRTIASAERAIEFIGEGAASPSIASLPPAEIVFITTPDSAISLCAEALAQSTALLPDTIVVHCSGSLSSKGLASVHPMRSFANPDLSVASFRGTFCAIEGDKKATAILRGLFERIGAVAFLLSPEKKSLYHAAGVFGSNYLVTLFERALHCLTKAGVDETLAPHIILNLMSGTLHNLQSTLSAPKSLTGPIKRGDIETIAAHLEAISDAETSAFYKSLGLATARIAGLPKDKETQIESLLGAHSPSFNFESRAVARERKKTCQVCGC